MIIWTNDGKFYQRIYASLCPNELKQSQLNCFTKGLALTAGKAVQEDCERVYGQSLDLMLPIISLT